MRLLNQLRKFWNLLRDQKQFKPINKSIIKQQKTTTLCEQF